MGVKQLRLQKGLSQEQLAESSGLSLRTIQRIESGESISFASKKALADYFQVSAESLTSIRGQYAAASAQLNSVANTTGRHRAMQLIILIVTFFVCVAQWLNYYAYITPSTSEASLWTILSYLGQIAVGAAILAYFFNQSRITFVRTYYLISAGFIAGAFLLGIWTQGAPDTTSSYLLYPVYFTLMMLALLVVHVLQMALSLKEESAALIQ